MQFYNGYGNISKLHTAKTAILGFGYDIYPNNDVKILCTEVGPGLMWQLISSFYITRIYVYISRFINSKCQTFSVWLHEKYLQRIACQKKSVVIRPDYNARRRSYEGRRL
jgi:hypothetical protein